MKEIFHSIDKDGSGKLDLGELRHAFHCIGIYYTDDEIADIIAEVDTDGTVLLLLYSSKCRVVLIRNCLICPGK